MFAIFAILIAVSEAKTIMTWDCPNEVAIESLETNIEAECFYILTNQHCVCHHSCKDQVRYEHLVTLSIT